MRVYKVKAATFDRKYNEIDRNMRHIGSGCHAEVYSDGEYAYKLCYSRSKYIDWLLSLKKDGLHKSVYVPRIHSIYKNKNRHQVIVKMELLKHGPNREMHRESNSIHWQIMDRQSRGMKIPIKTKKDVVLQHLANFIIKKKACIDMHSGNIMIRGKNQIVITDPVV